MATQLPSTDIAAALQQAQATIPVNLKECTREEFMLIKHNLWLHLMADRRIPHRNVDSYCTQLLKSVSIKLVQMVQPTIEPDTKQCSKCKETKSLLHFNKDKYSKDGLYHYCKQCNKERMQAYRAKPKTCAYCTGEPLPGAHFCQSCQEKYSEAFSQVRESGGTIKEADKYAREHLK